MIEKGKNINPELYSRFWKKSRTGQPAFSRPKADCLYVKILNLLADNSKVFVDGLSRKEVYEILGMNIPANYHNCVWTGMKNSGLISIKRTGKKFIYDVTDFGREFLETYGLRISEFTY